MEPDTRSAVLGHSANFAELKAKVGIEQVLSMLELSLKKQGEQLRGRCPVCKSGGDRGLVVTPDKGVFYCLGCKSGGDMIEFVARVRGYLGEDSMARAGLDIANHFALAGRDLHDADGVANHICGALLALGNFRHFNLPRTTSLADTCLVWV